MLKQGLQTMPPLRLDQNLHVPNKCLNSQEPKSTHEFLKPHTVIPIKLFITELRSGTAHNNIILQSHKVQ